MTTPPPFADRTTAAHQGTTPTTRAAARLAGVRGVLLDMDGTLVDSDAAVDRMWAWWAREHDVDVAAVLAACHGEAAETTIRRFRPDLDDATVGAQAAAHMHRESVDLDGVVAAVGAAAMIAAMTDLALPWAVVTNADATLAAARLGAAGIEPPALVTVDDVAAGKPDPAGYLLGARTIGAHPQDCLVVEDSAAGVTAGTASGALVAGLRGVPAALQVEDLAELALLLRGAKPAG